MANQWLRLWHDMPTDPKWKTIARVSGRSIAEVIAVFNFVLVDASAATERGTTDVNAEDVASALDMQTEQVAAILDAMQGRVLDGNRVTGWERRQPARDEGGQGGKPSAQNYVYYVVATGTNVVKIGFSRNPWARIKDLQVSSPNKYELLCTVKTDERSEASLHKFFTATRLGGEWFKRSTALNALIEKINAKEISEHRECLEFLSTLKPDMFTSTVDNYGSDGRNRSSTKDTDKDTDKELSRGRFTPPSVAEVAAYCNERNNGIDPEAFVSHYESTGWMRGKNKVKDWQACVRTWESSRKADNKNSQQQGIQLVSI